VIKQQAYDRITRSKSKSSHHHVTHERGFTNPGLAKKRHVPQHGKPVLGDRTIANGNRREGSTGGRG
jgi:hypothetical protein